MPVLIPVDSSHSDRSPMASLGGLGRLRKSPSSPETTFEWQDLVAAAYIGGRSGQTTSSL
ncbi:hypothetical protein TIFTF001_021772 [Ficus carica]|uniref:Uncharacterized protein n=1 Tax=Ficus carica TaxID=3494 RepID=A0AA88DC84_FICCA|nr:hypothetical protein TIFTF001_021772 [Ficus carica]